MAYKIIGINSDKYYCSSCGKTGIKKVVWLECLESGVNCAAYKMKGGFAKNKKAIDKKIVEQLETKVNEIYNNFISCGEEIVAAKLFEIRSEILPFKNRINDYFIKLIQTHKNGF